MGAMGADTYSPNTVRYMAGADYATWRELWLSYQDFYRSEVSEEVTRRSFDHLVEQSDGMVGLVAETDDGALVGFAHLVFHPSTWSTSTYCYLEDLFVAQPARGSTVARQLIAAVYSEADRRQAARTYWETQEYNGAARSLYDTVAHKTSFVIYER